MLAWEYHTIRHWQWRERVSYSKNWQWTERVSYNKTLTVNRKVYSIFSEKPEVDIILWKIKSHFEIIWFENLACMAQYRVQIVLRVFFFLKGGEKERQRQRECNQPRQRAASLASVYLKRNSEWALMQLPEIISAGLSGMWTSVLMTYIHETTTSQSSFICKKNVKNKKHRKLNDWSYFIHLHNILQNSDGFVILIYVTA